MSGNPLERIINWRVGMAAEPSTTNPLVVMAQQPFYDLRNMY